MSDKEFKVVTREETFNDLAVRELAKGRSACICRLQFGRCRKEECGQCEVHRQYAACYNQMNDYDRQRLATYISENWEHDSLFPEQWMSSSIYIWHVFKVALAFIIGLALICGVACLLSVPMAEPYSNVVVPVKQGQERVDCMIIETLRQSQAIVQDYNADGEINCIDYACGFKWQWDKLWPEDKWRCKLVRNKNGNWHHLFAHIDGYFGEDIEVETWTKNIRYYKMEYNWQWEYNPKYNIYGETEQWMKTCERRLNR